jgi:hypothetical protein
MNKFVKTLTVASVLTLTLTACSSPEPVEETPIPQPTTEATESATGDATENVSEEPESTIQPEIQEEKNTELVVQEILSAFSQSVEAQNNLGFLELTEGEIKAESSKYQRLLIEDRTEPNYIYIFETGRGFEGVTELTREQMPVEPILPFFATRINAVYENLAEKNVEKLTENSDFTKNITENFYTIKSNEIFFEPLTLTFTLNEQGLINKISIEADTFNETIYLQYGKTEDVNKYIEESIKPNRTSTPVE